MKFWKKKWFFDRSLIECVVDIRTTMTIDWPYAKTAKFKLSAIINMTYTLLCLQVRAKIIEITSPWKILYEFRPKERHFSKLAKTCHKGKVTIVAVSTWNRKGICYWTATNVLTNTWHFSAPWNFCLGLNLTISCLAKAPVICYASTIFSINPWLQQIFRLFPFVWSSKMFDWIVL